MKRHKHTYLLWLLLIAGFIFISSPFTTMGETGKDVVIKAMQDEMDRSMTSLKIEKMEKPYFLEYTVLDKQQLVIKANFGSLTKSHEDHKRLLKVGLRVGSYQMDNTGFMNRQNMFFSIMGRTRNMVTEDDYNAIRHDIWLAVDETYKQALEQYAGKKAFVKNHLQADEIPDFSREEKVTLTAPPKSMAINREKWENTVKKLSAVFRQFPVIHTSGVELKVVVNQKYYVNSEGTVFRQPETLVFLVGHASTQAEDGMILKHFVPFYASSIEGLSAEPVLEMGVKRMAEELTVLASAPVLQEYIGPVLFTKQASAEMFAQVLAPHLSGERPPLSEDQRMAEMVFSSKLAQRLNRKILPRDFSIVDDPTRKSFEKNTLIGHYQIDDQGVVPHRVSLVEKGVLKTFLMSRRPRKEIEKSNGHARAPVRGKAGVQIGNLFITTEKGKTYDQMKKELLQLCEDQQLPFGLIIKTVDNPEITGVEFSMASYMGGADKKTTITAPVMMYRVFAKDGHEELVRGISLSELGLKHLRDLYGVGNDYYVHHRFISGGGSTAYFPYFFYYSGGNDDMGIPCSIVAPSVLFEELEFKKVSETRKNPPLLKHPFFGEGDRE